MKRFSICLSLSGCHLVTDGTDRTARNVCRLWPSVVGEWIVGRALMAAKEILFSQQEAAAKAPTLHEQLKAWQGAE